MLARPCGRSRRVTTGIPRRRGRHHPQKETPFQRHPCFTGTLVGRTDADCAGYPHESGIDTRMLLYPNVVPRVGVSDYGISGHRGVFVRVFFVAKQSLAQEWWRTRSETYGIHCDLGLRLCFALSFVSSLFSLCSLFARPMVAAPAQRTPYIRPCLTGYCAIHSPHALRCFVFHSPHRARRCQHDPMHSDAYSLFIRCRVSWPDRASVRHTLYVRPRLSCH